jgi:GGDEF domain-containing protein
MRYRTFELLVIVFGTAAVLGTAVAGMIQGTGFAEIVAQLMLLPVLVAALHFGRNGGFLAALFATALYVGLRLPDLAQAGLASPLTPLVVVRSLTYILVGVVGGELASRIKYFFLSLENRQLVDEETGVYGSKHVGSLLCQLIEENRRYGHAFSTCSLDVDESYVPSQETRRRRGASLAKDIASGLRSDVRAVDEVGRVSPLGFLVLFPNTPADGGKVAARRLERTTNALLSRRGVQENAPAVTADVLSFPADSNELARIAEELTGEPCDVDDPMKAQTRADAPS